MNDINPATGIMMPQSFVHVTVIDGDTKEKIIKCSCAIFNLIQRTAKQQIKLWPEEEVIA